MKPEHSDNCARCNDANGFPCAVVTLTDPSPAWLVTYRCMTCGHEWWLKQDTPPWDVRELVSRPGTAA